MPIVFSSHGTNQNIMQRFFSHPAATTSAALAVFGLLALIAPQAQAQNALLTFEGQANTIYTSPIVRSSYQIGNPAGQEQHFHEIDSTRFGLPNNGTGILLNDRNTQIFLMADPGAAFILFSLTSVDVAASTGSRPADSLTLTGFLNGAPTGSVSVTFNGANYATLDGTALGTVDRLIFDGFGGGGGFVLDNVNLTTPQAPGGGGAIPEPGTVALLGTSLLPLAAAVARRRHRAPA